MSEWEPGGVIRHILLKTHPDNMWEHFQQAADGSWGDEQSTQTFKDFGELVDTVESGGGQFVYVPVPSEAERV